MKTYLEAVRASSVVGAYKRRLSEILALRPGERLVDIGCGLGDDLREAARVLGPEGLAVGIERDEKTLASLGDVRNRPEGLRFVAGTAEDLPFADGAFDVARIDRVLHLLPDPARALAEARRVVHGRGRLLVAEPLWASLRLAGTRLDRSPLARRIERATAGHPGVAGFDPVRLAREAGLRIDLEEPMRVVFDSPREARHLLHLDRTALALRLRRQIEAGDLADWDASLAADAADGSFRAELGGVVLLLSPGGRAAPAGS